LRPQLVQDATEDHFQIGDQFPFTYATTSDPLSGQRDGILAKCTADSTCPKVIHLDGSGEFWLGRASLIVNRWRRQRGVAA